jgi:hypothetical protein
MVELYLHSPIRFHGVVLNKLNTVTILPSLMRSTCPVYNTKLKINTEPKEPIKLKVQLKVAG